MPSHRPFFGRAPNSRSSVTRVTTMPIISEDEDLSKTASATASASASGTTSTPSSTTLGVGGPPPAPVTTGPAPAVAHVPRVPLRVPQKIYRRSAGPSKVPPYVPTTQMQPTLHYAEKKDAALEEDEYAQSKFQQLVSSFRKDHEDRMGYGENRRRTRFLLLVVLVVFAIVALAVGLGVGLTVGKHHANGSSTSNSDTNSFPAGSYAFNTTLQQTSTDCTSNPDTWRCYPYTTGASATFYWIITAVDPSNYLISSSNNPFAPSFSNVSTTLLDKGSPNERLTFSFSTNWTVIPSNALTPTDRAANCTYPDTVFSATLWTRMTSENTTLSSTPSGGSTKFPSWPTAVEVSQAMNATLGEPRCVDVSGDFIADVQAGSGQCMCAYSSFANDDNGSS